MRQNAGSLRLEKAEAPERYEIENRTAVCRTARTVVWEGGESSLPDLKFELVRYKLIAGISKL